MKPLFFRRLLRWALFIATLSLLGVFEWSGWREIGLGRLLGGIDFSLCDGQFQAFHEGTAGFLLRVEDSTSWAWGGELHRVADEWRAAVPLWIVVLPVVMVTAIVWSLPRYPRGACRYDRAGLPVGAPCPECGRPAPNTEMARSRATGWLL